MTQFCIGFGIGAVGTYIALCIMARVVRRYDAAKSPALRKGETP